MENARKWGNPFVALFALPVAKYFSVANIYWLISKQHNANKLLGASISQHMLVLKLQKKKDTKVNFLSLV